jgi:TATA-box binding protein (TBP) (component of TFIID and TFIIIB)
MNISHTLTTNDDLINDDLINDDWENFCNDDYVIPDNIELHSNTNNNTHVCSDIYISTKTKISFLSQKIDLKATFWEIKITPYHIASDCIIKKQMKFNCYSEEEYLYLQSKLQNEIQCEEYIITRIVNPDGRIKFKDIRKISIGICKKDILSYRTKKKSAFYNCFVLILRIKFKGIFREIHVKVFNTGKLEIPGIQSDELLEKVLELLITILKPIISDNIKYLQERNETVLINSNFNCGFYINRDKMYEILKYKYNINSGYDPCSYPGIQCKFYYDKRLTTQTGKQPDDITEFNTSYIKMSFMIFRTGSVLIVGKCNEIILHEIYEFIKNILLVEYQNIVTHNNNINIPNIIKKKKIRRKTIMIS